MKRNMVSALSLERRAALVDELVARVELAEKARHALAARQIQWGVVLERALLEAALSGFSFCIEEARMLELQEEAERIAARVPARVPPPPTGPPTEPAAPAPVAPPIVAPVALGSGVQRVWVKPGRFARALTPRLEGLGMKPIREGDYAGGYEITVSDAEAARVTTALRDELRVPFEQEPRPP